jgi:hypothetical protein
MLCSNCTRSEKEERRFAVRVCPGRYSQLEETFWVLFPDTVHRTLL